MAFMIPNGVYHEPSSQAPTNRHMSHGYQSYPVQATWQNGWTAVPNPQQRPQHPSNAIPTSKPQNPNPVASYIAQSYDGSIPSQGHALPPPQPMKKALSRESTTQDSDKLMQYEPAQYSRKQVAGIKAYAHNTNTGNYRVTNEDRVSINVEIKKPSGFKGAWPSIHFFGIFDGHNGEACAEYVAQNLSVAISENASLLSDPQNAIIAACLALDQRYFGRCCIDLL